MSFLFKRSKHNGAKDGQVAGEHTSKKLRKNVRRHNSTRRPSASMSAAVMRNKSLGNAAKPGKTVLSKESKSNSKGNGLAAIADVVLDPVQYTELLLQASAARDRQMEQDHGNGDLEVPPPTPLRQHSTRGERQRQYQSRSGPQRQSQSQSQVPRTLSNSAVDAIVEGVTYDAILASTVNRTFNGRGILTTEEDGPPPPETRVPPNSPAVSLRLRRSAGGGDNGFGSLVGVAKAIMENRVRIA